MKKQINLVLRINEKSALLTLSVFVLLIFSSCKRDILSNTGQQIKTNTALPANISTARLGLPYQEGIITLGQKLSNPYVLTLMQQAKTNLQSKGVISQFPINIRETHYYVKFKPRNWNEYDDLKEDSTLDLSDIPYDYEITKNGNYYHDPTINDTLPTYQYATVPAGFHFNDTIPYEIISPLYIPEADNTLLGTSDQNESFVENLLNEAYTLTGNYEDTIPIENYTQRKYFPSGRIQIFDTRLNTIYGLEGLKVTARRWFIVYTAYCDRFGQYIMSKRFTRPCNYSAWFENKRILVKKGGVHWINGPKQTDPWNHTINDGFDRFAGHIFRAAYRYHYKDIGGLQRPFRWLGRKTAYIAKDGEGTGVNPIVLNNIKIWRFKNKAFDEWGSDDIFSTTCHETGHTSHSIRMNTVFQFWQVGRQLQESWAVCIEWYLTHLEYAEKGITNYGEWNYRPSSTPNFPNEQAYQFWNKAEYSGWYTTMYIDVIDNHNELGVFYPGWGSGVVNDQVSGYSLPFIESELLKHIYGLASLKEKLKEHKPAGITDEQIDLLIGFYY
jgi:hypothetical protein